MRSIILNTITGASSRAQTWVMLVIFTLIGLQAQAQCETRVMACNNLINVSLDTNCVAVITPDAVLEAPSGDQFYRVEVFTPDGDTIIWDPEQMRYDTIREDYNKVLLETRVYCIETGIYCWGYIRIEDKIKPELEITPLDTAVSCFVYPFDLEPNALVTKVSFSDNGCEKPDSLGIVDIEETIYPCGDTVRIIKRFWSVVDAAGNETTVVQTIYLLRGKISDLEFPRDTIIDCLMEGDLSVDKLGFPEERSCTNFEITYNDIEIPVCGKARKILRRWSVTDVCSTEDTIYTQVIKIEDNYAPEMDFSVFNIPTDRLRAQKFNCLADAEDIPNPIVTDCNIDQTTLQAFYQLVDQNNNPTGPLFDAYVNDLETFDLRDIPIGEKFVVIFVADDGCGNISRDTSGVVMATDTQAPNAVCEGNTTVVLNNEGITEVLAETFDDHSFDNCGIVDKRVRRYNETIFRDKITFSCDDVPNNPIRVVFRVFDAAGLSSDCIVNVYVQDKRPITLTCAGDRVFNCDVTREEVKSALEAEVPAITESCGITSLELTIPDYELSACGTASFVVTWVAVDANGQTSTCSRNVSIENVVDATVDRPDVSTFNVESCGASVLPKDIPGSEPTVLNVDCERIAITYDDNRLMGEPDACVKIIRTWTILDWCRFDGGNYESAIVDQFDQTIIISDSTEPEFSTECMDITISDNEKDCQENVTLIAAATDDCTLPEEIVYTYEVDMNNDGSIDATGESNDASGDYAVGQHRVRFTATDVCGNTAECEYFFTVRSTKEPLVVLLSNVEVALDDGGQVILEAASVDASSSNGCLPDGVVSDASGLIFAFDEAGTQLTRTFTCADVPNGRGALIDVTVWVIDSLGNKEFQVVTVTVSDNESMACPDVEGAAVIAGQITDEAMNVVAGVPVVAVNMATGEKTSVESDEYGIYTFNNLEQYEDYQIQPQLEDYALAGVTTIDIVYIQQHILGLTRLQSPYKLLAADVNGSKSITAADLVELRRVILGRSTDFDAGNWKFVDGEFEFDMDGDMYTYDDKIEVINAKEVDVDHNFVGLKVGDVNGNAFTVLAQGYVGPRSTEVFDVRATRRGDIVRYGLSIHSMKEIIGFQMAINLSDDMKVVALGSDHISLSEEDFVVTEDALRISWSNATTIDAENNELFFIDIKVQGNKTPTLSTQGGDLPAEVYDGYLKAHNVVLELREQNIESDAVLLHQNVPNPFTTTTDISFEMPQAGTAHLTINDINGRSVYEETGLFKKGLNTIRINANDIHGSGIYYYTIISDGYKETRRMIVLN